MAKIREDTELLDLPWQVGMIRSFPYPRIGLWLAMPVAPQPYVVSSIYFVAQAWVA